jgi:hypothetical protein
MKAQSIFGRLGLAILFSMLAPFACAQDGAQGALSRLSFTTPLDRRVAVADLDGDHKPDGAILLKSRWLGPQHNLSIQLHFTDRPNSELTFQSNSQALTVTAWDIDQDGDIDLVVEEAFSHKPISVWINEGHGDFHEGRVQDYPSLAATGSTQIQAPPDQRDCPALSLPSQRGFEKAVLTNALLARPPSNNNSLLFLITSGVARHPDAPNSSRAPPLV